MRTYIKGGSKMLKIVKQNKEVNENEKNEEEMKMKKWSLKKKLLVGAAAGIAGVVSVIAYGKSKPSNSVECDMDEEDDEDDNEQFLDNEEQDRNAELGNDETETEK